MTHALAGWRPQYPIFERSTYLASHSLGAVPRATADALAQYHREWAELGIGAWDGPWWQAVLDFSAGIETLLGAAPQTVVPLQNATRGMAAVASALEFTPPRNRIVMSNLEFTTSFAFWRGVEQRLGAQLVIIASDDGMTVPLERFAEAIDERTLLVATSHVYFRSAAVCDLAAVTRLAHEAGAYVLGDGYQAVGTVPVDVTSDDVDFYVGGSHKWLCGGAGAAFLYVRPDRIEALQPWLSGWFGLADPFAYHPGTESLARSSGIMKYMGGTPNVPALYAAREGQRIVRQLGLPAIREVSMALGADIAGRAAERGLELRSPADPAARSGMLCLDFEGAEPACAALNEAGVIVDWRPECGLRVSAHFYNTTEDVDRLFEVLDGVRAG